MEDIILPALSSCCENVVCSGCACKISSCPFCREMVTWVMLRRGCYIPDQKHSRKIKLVEMVIDKWREYVLRIRGIKKKVVRKWRAYVEARKKSTDTRTMPYTYETIIPKHKSIVESGHRYMPFAGLDRYHDYIRNRDNNISLLPDIPETLPSSQNNVVNDFLLTGSLTPSQNSVVNDFSHTISLTASQYLNNQIIFGTNTVVRGNLKVIGNLQIDGDMIVTGDIIRE